MKFHPVHLEKTAPVCRAISIVALCALVSWSASARPLQQQQEQGQQSQGQEQQSQPPQQQEQPPQQPDRPSQSQTGQPTQQPSSPDQSERPAQSASPQDQPAPAPPQNPNRPPVSSRDRVPDQNSPDSEPPDAPPYSQSPYGGRYGQPYGRQYNQQYGAPGDPNSPNSQDGRPPQPPFAPAPALLTIPAATVVVVRTNDFLSSDHSQVGDQFTATLQQPLIVNGYVVARRGQTVIGKVKSVQKAGRVKGTSQLGIELTDITLVDGTQAPVLTELWKASGGTSHGADAGTIVGGTAVGAAIGAAADWGRGAAIGAGAGAVAGIGAVLLTRGRPTILAPESLLSFKLVDAVKIDTTQSSSAFVPPSQEDFGRGRPALRGYGYGPEGYGPEDDGPYPYAYAPPPCGYYYPCYGYYRPYVGVYPWFGGGFYGRGFYGRGFYGRGFRRF